MVRLSKCGQWRKLSDGTIWAERAIVAFCGVFRGMNIMEALAGKGNALIPS